jgi:hypothetical protein
MPPGQLAEFLAAEVKNMQSQNKFLLFLLFKK